MPFESAARAAFASRMGRTVTDVEWAGARARFLEFATILHDWDQKTKNGESGFGNV
jgi:hypothetical protein